MPMVRHDPISENSLESYHRQDFPDSVRPIIFPPPEGDIIGPKDVIPAPEKTKRK